jgi:SAM-dependent methyltransferase
MADRLLSRLAGQTLGLALDAATGKAPFLLRLAARLPSRAWLALDTQPAQLAAGRSAVAQAQPGLSVIWLAGRVEALPLADGTVDTACLSCSLHHLADPEAGLAELLRVLRPGGLLLVNEMIRDGLDERQALHRDVHHLNARIDRALGIGHRETLALAELRGLLEALPLADLDWIDQRFAPLPPEDEENIRRLDGILDGALDRCPEGPLRQAVAAEAASIKERLRKLGWDWATQWTAIGRKAA